MGLWLELEGRLTSGQPRLAMQMPLMPDSVVVAKLPGPTGATNVLALEPASKQRHYRRASLKQMSFRSNVTARRNAQRADNMRVEGLN
jgi:hypothetical protein